MAFEKKNEIVETIAARIRAWEHPILVHESLKKLAEVAGLPQEILGVDVPLPRMQIARSSPLAPSAIDPDRILEMDLLRWLLLSPDPASFSLRTIQKNLSTEDFKIPACRGLFGTYLDLSFDERREWLTLAGHLKKKEEQEILNELLQKKVNKQKIEEYVLETIKKLLHRNWMEKKEQILQKMKQNISSDEEVILLTKQFDELCKNPPQVLKD